MDETFQQAYHNTTGVVTGNFITGLVLPPNSTLPTTDQGPIAMNETWYFWDPTTGKYLPQTSPFKASKNYVRNSCYQVQQSGTTFTLAGGITNTYDMALARSPVANVLAITPNVGPVAGADNDLIPAAMKYTVGPTLVATPAATDLYTHEHLIEGSDIIMLQGQQMSLSFSVYPTVTGSYSVYLTNNGRDSSYVATFAIGASQVNAWNRIKIANIPAFPVTGTWSYGEGVTGLYIGIPMAMGSQWQTTTPNTWVSGLRCGIASNVNMLTVVNNQLTITGIKLEASPGPTYFSANSFSTDYQDCIRYYNTSFEYQTTTAGVALHSTASSTTIVFLSRLFPRRMCKSPSVIPFGFYSKAAGNITNTSTGNDTAIANLPATNKGISAYLTISGATKGDTYAAHYIADARLS